MKLCYAEATWLFAKMEREPTSRHRDEAKIESELAAAELALLTMPDPDERKQHCEFAVAKIVAVATAAFVDQIEQFGARIDWLNGRKPTPEMSGALNLIEVRVLILKKELSHLKQKANGRALLSALAQDLASECRTVQGLLSTCERAANSMRGWIGSRREWVVAIIVAVVVGLALIPVTLMISDRWERVGVHPSSADQQTIHRSRKLMHQQRDASPTLTK